MVITMDDLTAEDIEILKSELVQLKKQRDELDAQIKVLNDKRDEIDKECSIRKGKIESYKLLHSLENVNDSNSMTVFLRSNTQTTPMLDEFYNSDKEFLVLKWILSAPKNSYFDDDILGDLVIVRYDFATNKCYSSSPLTITDLKKCGRIDYKFAEKATIVDHKYHSSKELTERCFSLCLDLKSIFEKHPKRGDKCLFSCPIEISGQLYDDQENIGFHDYDDITFYGQTTPFLIIGAIFN